jgi:hypothetical protein
MMEVKVEQIKRPMSGQEKGGRWEVREGEEEGK